MAAKTPRTDEVRTVYMAEARTGPQPETVAKNAAAFDRWLEATLAAVRPNPDDARQVEVVNRALCEYTGRSPGSRYYDDAARAVLAALAAEVGRRG